MYYTRYENLLSDIPDFEERFAVEYLEFYKRHLLSNSYKEELDNFYSNTNLTINAIIFKYLNLEFSKFLKEKSTNSLEVNYFNWKNNENNSNNEIFSENFYYKILDCILNKIISCLDECDNINDCCNICLESNVHLKCNKCNLYYHKNCLIKYILNNFKYCNGENGKLYHIINYEVSCPQCRKYFLTNLKIDTPKESYSSNKKL